jgi:hypothetical protein
VCPFVFQGAEEPFDLAVPAWRVGRDQDVALDLGDHSIDLANVRVPVLSIAGSTDTLAPRLRVVA